MEVKLPLLWHATLLAVVLLVKPLSQTTLTTFPVTPDMESSVALFEFGTDVGVHPPAAHTMDDGGEGTIGLAGSGAASSKPATAHDLHSVASAARNGVRRGFVRILDTGGRARNRRAFDTGGPLVARVTGAGKGSVGVGALCVGVTVVRTG
jgi:hypothetical protein